VTSTTRRWLRDPVAVGVGVFLLGCLLGHTARFVLIEPEDLYRTCLGGGRPAWCEPRDLLIVFTFTLVRGIWGWIALGCGVAAWLLDGRVVAVFVMAALLAGGVGLYLYAAPAAAFGTLLALLRLVRLREIAMRQQFHY
jgi:hypothetical protein